MYPDRLGKYFTLEELTTNGRHPEIDNDPPIALAGNAIRLGAVLDDARDLVGRVRITYGYRGPALNEACGGSKTSAHVEFCAADCVPLDMSLQDAFDKLIANDEFMENVDQIIIERGCIHIGIALERNKFIPRHEIRKEDHVAGRRVYPLIRVWRKADG